MSVQLLLRFTSSVTVSLQWGIRLRPIRAATGYGYSLQQRAIVPGYDAHHVPAVLLVRRQAVVVTRVVAPNYGSPCGQVVLREERLRANESAVQ